MVLAALKTQRKIVGSQRGIDGRPFGKHNVDNNGLKQDGGGLG